MLPLANELLKAGFKHVMLIDFYGRGHSSAPSVTYDATLFVEQLREVLTLLNIRKVSIVALSFSGAIAAAFTHRYPALVESISLMAPAGVPFQLPLVGQLLNFEPLGRFLLQSWLGLIVQNSRVPMAFGNQQTFATDIDEFKQENYFHWLKPNYAHAYTSTVANFLQVTHCGMRALQCFIDKYPLC
jgi:pimeloyl-ACP methyl ester carboxylesterase